MLLNTKTLNVTSPVIPNLLGVSSLVASKISGTEGINQLFEYTIELRTDLALYGQAITEQIKLDEMAGRELTAHIALDGDGSFLTGVVAGGLMMRNGVRLFVTGAAVTAVSAANAQSK